MKQLKFKTYSTFYKSKFIRKPNQEYRDKISTVKNAAIDVAKSMGFGVDFISKVCFLGKS